jgi:hypothetical protein
MQQLIKKDNIDELIVDVYKIIKDNQTNFNKDTETYQSQQYFIYILILFVNKLEKKSLINATSNEIVEFANLIVNNNLYDITKFGSLIKPTKNTKDFEKWKKIKDDFVGKWINILNFVRMKLKSCLDNKNNKIEKVKDILNKFQI